MKRLMFMLLVCATVCSAQRKTPSEVLRVNIEANAWSNNADHDRNLLLDKLSKCGLDHGIKFELVSENFTYHIFLTIEHKETPVFCSPEAEWKGEGPCTIWRDSIASVQVYDAKGIEVFEVKSTKDTDAGATNAIAKEIVKRLLRTQKHKA